MSNEVILEKELSTYLIEKAPYTFEDNLKEVFVKWIPIISLIILIISAPFLLVYFGLGSVLGGLVFLGGASSGFAYWVTFILTIVVVGFRVISLQGLFGRKRQGWVFMYYGLLTDVLMAILTLSFFSLVFDVVWLYIAFQIKDKYN
jgi:hypothetical protein